ncbi:hypothetical protein [Streptomyces cavernae]|uniref:hypothetical protein n=1 Tax=Streptomyces cavernae TaxID=2259034 RepID=UPI0012D879E9|nr:hypothetical protein [Streptomyces cavernae]
MLPEPIVARWTLTAALPEPVVARWTLTAALPEPVVARWTLTAALPERVAVPPVPAARPAESAAEPPPDAGLSARTGAGPPATVGVGLPNAAARGPTGPAAGDGSPSGAPGAAQPGAVRPPVPVMPMASSRRATGRARRCPAGGADALVNESDRDGRCCRGGTGVTRGPAGRDAVTGRGARCTGAVSSRTSSAAPGRSARTGGRVCEGGSSPETGLADVVSASLTRPPGAPSRTAWDRVPVKEGFCQVLSRPPNPESATPVHPTAARWIGGNATQPAAEADPGATSLPASAGARAPESARAEPPPPAAEFASTAGIVAELRPSAAEFASTAGLAPAAGSVPDARRAAVVAGPPLSRSRNPTSQPSAPPRVTRDAICSV